MRHVVGLDYFLRILFLTIMFFGVGWWNIQRSDKRYWLFDIEYAKWLFWSGVSFITVGCAFFVALIFAFENLMFALSFTGRQ